MTERLIDAGGLLILPRLKVQNANAVSGPLSWGFPAPTAFTGFVHALERRLGRHLQVMLDGVGIVCHGFEAQTSQPAGRRTRVFHLTRHPVGRDGGAPSLVEEGRAHLEITLVIAVKQALDDYDGDLLTRTAFEVAHGMRLAGGSLLPPRNGKRYEPLWQCLPDYLDGQAETFQKLRRRLLPGFALVQRDDLLRERLAEMQARAPATALDALLDLCRLNIEPRATTESAPDKVEWSIRKKPGWLVPLPIGYAGISELYAPGEVANARDGETPFRFVESLYSLGEWIGPHRLESLQQLLWHIETDAENGIYRCVNRYAQTLPSTASHKE
ncbi:type I-F CRISPR-associated protein Csy2 [Methylococcus geothermalis]|uniref:Type I-F CRISPR-associated protein Csy2 n=1 Tax=Methylococcus geothermalis TaxID=2681310 RepID=A0A858Q6C4_9GAMM|nr:type I-F CRISPR-associated protein Csy2 [Methylococcus geothermalis]QJD29389.1 type I-F CRISPR-associated protein Csy2 [Methylococcus geothermalis]